ncbi:MAG: flagellar biosynthesis anti-sigma factor FlgM [Pseudomonadota bacterium]
MKIDDAAKKAPGLGQVANQGRAAKSAEKADVDKAAGKATETVSLSSQSQALAGAAKSGAVFDVAKVQEIKDAIASGRFQVNAEKVAENIIELSSGLLRSPKG